MTSWEAQLQDVTANGGYVVTEVGVYSAIENFIEYFKQKLIERLEGHVSQSLIIGMITPELLFSELSLIFRFQTEHCQLRLFAYCLFWYQGQVSNLSVAKLFPKVELNYG